MVFENIQYFKSEVKRNHLNSFFIESVILYQKYYFILELYKKRKMFS